MKVRGIDGMEKCSFSIASQTSPNAVKWLNLKTEHRAWIGRTVAVPPFEPIHARRSKRFVADEATIKFG